MDEDTPGLVRRDHPDTSREAAASTVTGKLRVKVYEFIVRRGQRGATDEEIIEAGIKRGYLANGIRPRRVELVRYGWIIDSGERRPTRSGRSAIVWVVNPDRESAPTVAGTGPGPNARASESSLG